MKKFIYFTLILPIFIISCQKSPEAHFSTGTSEPVVGQEVFFLNSSHNSSSYEWDFGDGFTSNDENPVHVYNATGNFDVSLIAISKNGKEDKAFLTLNVTIPTLVEIEVREYYSEDLVPNASVILYPTIADWDAQTNKVIEGFTDSKGDVVFANLDPYTYYVDVWAQNYDNYALRSEDYQTYIQTPGLLEHQVNWFIAWVDVADHSSGADRGSRPLVIKKLQRINKQGAQSGIYPGTETWQELYKRAIKK